MTWPDDDGVAVVVVVSGGGGEEMKGGGRTWGPAFRTTALPAFTAPAGTSSYLSVTLACSMWQLGVGRAHVAAVLIVVVVVVVVVVAVAVVVCVVCRL